MTDKPNHTPLETTQNEADAHLSKPHRHILRNVLLSLFGVMFIGIVILTGITLYLSGPRLTNLINTRASEYFNADIRAGKCQFTLWSTFPRFCIEIDSLEIVSRTLRGKDVSSAQRAALPANADSLASLKSFRGAINIPALLAGRFELHDVMADGMRLNLVTLNDSINNFNIVPQTDSVPFKIPYISANRISLTNIRNITFYSAPDTLSATAIVQDVSLSRKDKTDTYNLLFKGDISANLDKINLCRNLPFQLGGEIKFGFNPFAVALRNMRLNLANTESRVNMSMNLGEHSGIDDFRTEISAFDIMKLLAYLPSEFIPQLKGLETDMRTVISVRLTKPYRFSDGGLPTFVAELRIPSSSLTYTLDNGESYRLDDITLAAELNFNGDEWQNSSCTIDELKARGEGLALLLNGEIARIFTEPQLAANIHIDLNIQHLASIIPSLNRITPQGNGVIDAKVNFPVSILSEGEYTAVPIDGTARLAGLAVRLPDGSDINAKGLDILFSNSSAGRFSASGDAKGINISIAQNRSVTIPDITLSGAGTLTQYTASAMIPNLAFRAPKENVDISACGTAVAYDGNLLSLSMDNLSADISKNDIAAHNVEASIIPDGRNSILSLTAATLTATLPSHRHLSVKGLHAKGNTLTNWHLGSDAITWSMPDFGVAERQFNIRASRWNGAIALTDNFRLRHVSLNLPEAHLNTVLYDAPIEISRLRADMAGLDSITLHSLRLRSQLTALDLAAALKIDSHNGKRYYSGHADIDFDTLHFNQIAHNIERGPLYHGNRPGADPKDSLATPRSYRPMMVADNFDITASLRADATVYTNLWLTDLGAEISMRPGRLALDTVYLSANFGHAQLAAEYLSPDKDNISLNGGFHIQNFDLTKFFDSYPKVLAMMPEMGNLHGLFHADTYFHTGIFPNMEINTASTIADISASATDMYLHQNNFIRRVARMAMIFEKGDINIPAIRAHARVFDRMLTVYPFNIHIGKYELQAAGRNDFSGDLYYHVGVLHNPLLPIKFGIDIRGIYGDPHIRFAGPDFSIKHSEAINGIDVMHHINLIDELHHGGLLLLHHAAKAQILSDQP